ncbi:hypothetical protein HERIO_2132 [Hepatospora eriocheir]|uniref:Uncharacterized protein n=1 Tax=Hepatospora eriocheir TaxID=1081669 RepID=A0A1X0Q7Z8_9MICR|nr:hypothetical protein HERIO_2132 [Hepatospora eriocheir]
MAKVVVERCWCKEDRNMFEKYFYRYSKAYESYSNCTFIDKKTLFDFQLYYHAFVNLCLLKSWSPNDRKIFQSYYPFFKKDWAMYTRQVYIDDYLVNEIKSKMTLLDKTDKEIREYYNVYYKKLNDFELGVDISKYGIVNDLSFFRDELIDLYFKSGRKNRKRENKLN